MSWLHIFQIQDAGASLRVDAPGLNPLAAGLYSACRRSLAPCSSTTAADLSWETCASGQLRLCLSGRELEPDLDEAELYFQSEHLLNQLFAKRLAHWLTLHAAVVADPAGRAWLLCGPSRAGKTSLAVALILNGWQWLSDEWALLDPADPTRLLGFHRNFNLKETSFPFFPETAGGPRTRELFSSYRGQRVRFFDPDDFAPGAARAEARLAGVVFPRFDPQLPSALIHRQPGLAAVQGLLAELAVWQPAGLALLGKIAREMSVFEFVYPHPRGVEPLIAAMTSASP